LKFSVLISIYSKDDPKLLHIALESIWGNQVLKPNQIVLVKDGPLDENLEAVLNIWKIKLGGVLTIVPLPINRGLAKALNEGLKYCQYNLVARMDSDDISLPDRFLKQINYFKINKNIDILGGWGKIIDESGQVKGRRTQPESDREIKKILWACPIIHVSAMFNRDSIIRIGAYDSKVGWRQEDYELWIRAGFNGLIFGNIQDYLVKYRVNIRKNTLLVGYNRSKLGLKAVRKFDPRLYSYIAVLYPFVRSLCPLIVSQKLEEYFTKSKYDPRRGENNNSM